MFLYPPPPVPPPALVARDLRARWMIDLHNGGEPLPVAWDAVFWLDGLRVTGKVFFAGAVKIVGVAVHEGQIDRMDATSR